MRYLTFTPDDQTSYDICFLSPQVQSGDMVREYIEPHLSGAESEILAYTLHKAEKRTPVAEQREYLDELLPILNDLQVRYLVVCDGEYLKTLTKAAKVDDALGYVLDCAHPGFEHMKVIYCPNFRQIFYNPDKVRDDIRISLTALNDHRDGIYLVPGHEVIKFAAYPQTVGEIDNWLQKLLEMNCSLSADIEAFSLKHHTAGIGTISFSWNKHEGIAFPVDLLESPEDAQLVRAMLRDFFVLFASRSRALHEAGHPAPKMLWHQIHYDVYVLIYQLFMGDLLDTSGLLIGLEVMLESWECTRLISYLATNSCAGNKLKLKFLAHEFAGNYAIDEIKNIRKVPLDRLLQYNLVDTLATWFVYDKNYGRMVSDNQLQIYEEIFKPGIKDIIQMQLTGLPLDMGRVHVVKDVLQEISDHALQRMHSNNAIQAFLYDWRLGWIEKENQKLKTKTRSMDEAEKAVSFNPNSNDQLQSLLFDEKHFGLPVLELTKNKNPSTEKDTLESLVNHTQDPQIKAFIEALIEYKAIDKILTSFIPAFLKAPQASDGWHYLFGYFNLGGTVSGRLSSSKPNLQNLPANIFVIISEALFEKHKALLEPYMKKGKLALGKFIKSCFAAPEGYLLIGLDFASLEDRISALTTKDPNKLKVYTDGYDGHCLRAYTYFEELMPDIDPGSVESINSIEKLYPAERQNSKPPTFALTYQGTYITLIKNCGFTEELAKRIEARYHELYQVSDAWVASQIAQAGKQGYIEVAFGLRVRTPLLRQVILGTSRTPFEAEAEGRTAGNALGQSWCLLNTRASIAFMALVRSGKYKLNIRPCAHIHDAQYYMIPNDLAVLLYVNEHLVREVQWQDHPAIAHDEVKLGGEVSIFFPTWADECVIPNHASVDMIAKISAEHQQKHCGG